MLYIHMFAFMCLSSIPLITRPRPKTRDGIARLVIVIVVQQQLHDPLFVVRCHGFTVMQQFVFAPVQKGRSFRGRIGKAIFGKDGPSTDALGNCSCKER